VTSLKLHQHGFREIDIEMDAVAIFEIFFKNSKNSQEIRIGLIGELG